MAETTNISKLIINYLTEEQYATAKASGLINENELYVTDVQDSTTLDCFEELFTATEGQTLFTLTEGTYQVGESRLTICVNGAQQPSTAYTETSSSSFTFDSGLSVGDSVIARYFNSRITSNITLQAHKSSHASAGSDALTPSDIGAATSTHTHGNITNGGAVGSTPNLPIFTGDSGLLETKSIEDAKTLLGIVDSYQIGDVLTTIRTDLGVNWSLSNGQYFNKSSYLELYNKALIKAIYGTSSINSNKTVYTDAISKIPYDSEYSDTQIAVSTGKGILWCDRQNPFSWSFTSFASMGFTATTFAYPTISYINNKWIVTAVTPPTTGSSHFLAVGTCSTLNGTWSISNSVIDSTYMYLVSRFSKPFLINNEIHMLIFFSTSSGWNFFRCYDLKANDSTLFTWTSTLLTFPEQGASAYFPEETRYYKPLVDGNYIYCTTYLKSGGGLYKVNIVKIDITTFTVTDVLILDPSSNTTSVSNVIKFRNDFYYFRYIYTADTTSNTIYLYKFTSTVLTPTLVSILVIGAGASNVFGSFTGESLAILYIDPLNSDNLLIGTGNTNVAKLWNSGEVVSNYSQPMNAQSSILTETEIITYPYTTATSFVISYISKDTCQVPTITTTGAYNYIKIL